MIGAAVPTAFVGQTLPSSLFDNIPALRAYTYVKLSDKAVIVDPMSHKIAEINTLP